eukprot:scaffold31179_cov63-Phaeocystis_antarctica.AAC.3
MRVGLGVGLVRVRRGARVGTRELDCAGLEGLDCTRTLGIFCVCPSLTSASYTGSGSALASRSAAASRAASSASTNSLFSSSPTVEAPSWVSSALISFTFIAATSSLSAAEVTGADAGAGAGAGDGDGGGGGGAGAGDAAGGGGFSLAAASFITRSSFSKQSAVETPSVVSSALSSLARIAAGSLRVMATLRRCAWCGA